MGCLGAVCLRSLRQSESYTPDWSTVVGTSLAASTVGNTIGFASMSFDAVTGFYNDKARGGAAPQSARSSAPIRARAGIKYYRYCGNDSIDETDPTGDAARKWDPNLSQLSLVRMWQTPGKLGGFLYHKLAGDSGTTKAARRLRSSC